jgi:hypothetical protein
MQVKDYEIRLPLLEEFPDFFNLAEKPRELVLALMKISVFKNGELVGTRVPVDDAIEIAAAISGRLSPK